MLETSEFAWARETAGTLLQQAFGQKIDELELHLQNVSDEVVEGALVGLELAQYRFVPAKKKTRYRVVRDGKKLDAALLSRAESLARAVNLARHLVNLPPNQCQPGHFEAHAKSLLRGKKNCQLEVWDHRRLKKENMNLHLGVGQGSSSPPRLLIVTYRPARNPKKLAPVALVGKGITFDSGGLDLKPSAAMRLMKKDMGGAAAALAAVLWASENQIQRPVTAYLALAENMVDASSFRPSDVLESRSGLKVEIHNTDAEGRLVLADAIDVAVSAKTKPELVIDLATLTGAIKTALGAEIAGLFSNEDTLSDKIEAAAQKAGDLVWRMPLFSKYTAGFSSPFADLVNAVDGFGGAITAALFLEKFVRGVPWAHLDIYAWNDKPTGALAFSGGTGQGVQLLSHLLRDLE